MPTGTPEQVLKTIVDGINAGNLDALMTLYEPEAAFATQPGNLAHGSQGTGQNGGRVTSVLDSEGNRRRRLAP